MTLLWWIEFPEILPSWFDMLKFGFIYRYKCYDVVDDRIYRVKCETYITLQVLSFSPSNLMLRNIKDLWNVWLYCLSSLYYLCTKALIYFEYIMDRTRYHTVLPYNVTHRFWIWIFCGNTQNTCEIFEI